MAVILAFVVDLVGVGVGFSEDGFGWAFRMPFIQNAGLVALTASVGGAILSVLRLQQQRGRDVLMWFVLGGTGLTGLVGLLLIVFSRAASASI